MTWTPRRIDLATVGNLREVGGARAGTSAVTHGVLYRSMQLAGVSAPDQAVLQDLHLTLIVDLRTKVELEQAPDQPFAAYTWLDVRPDSARASQASMEPRFADPKALQKFLSDGTA